MKARAVIGPDGIDAPPDPLGAVDRRVDRQIAALRVSAQTQPPPGVLFCHFFRVLHRPPLGGNLRHAGQGEVLLPSGQGVVRSPKGQIHRLVPRLDGQGGKLFVRTPFIGEAVEAHRTEAAGRRHLPEKFRNGDRD